MWRRTTLWYPETPSFVISKRAAGKDVEKSVVEISMLREGGAREERVGQSARYSVACAGVGAEDGAERLRGVSCRSTRGPEKDT